MFTEIGIENFKAFAKMQKIPLKPITLLYGPNSSGKSSILQSLLLLKQTSEESGDDSIVLLPKGNLVDLGGFHEYIHGHDLKKDFIISISFKYSSWVLFEYGDTLWNSDDCPDLGLEFSFTLDKGQILLSSIKVGESFHVDPIMEWKNIWSIPYLKQAVLKKKNDFLKEGDSLEDLERWESELKRSVMVLDSINSAHYIMKHYWEQQCLIKLYGRGKVTKSRYCEPNNRHYLKTIKELAGLKKSIEKEVQSMKEKTDYYNVHKSDMNDEDQQEKKDELRIQEAKIRQLRNILRLSKKIHLSLIHESYDEIQNIRNFPVSDRLMSLANCFPKNDDGYLKGTEEWLFQDIFQFAEIGKPVSDTPEVYSNFNYLSTLLTYASTYLKYYLGRIIYIGPIREYPERAYSYSGNVPLNVGKSGKSMPDILMKRPDLVNKVNEWFDKFDIGYKLKIEKLRRNLFSLLLVDKNSGVDTSPNDVGFGIGQLLPIIVQGILSKNKIIIIEQPEIHVHPRLQAELGSFIAAMAGRSDTIPEDYVGRNFIDPSEEEYGNQFIIETHSENLVLRFQKLIRKGELRKEDIAVIYCDKTTEGTVATELHLNDKGEFIDPWPHGFFEESFDELFGD